MDPKMAHPGATCRRTAAVLCLQWNRSMADWDPELYNRFRQYRAEPVEMMIARLSLGGGERIADLGCGSGENTIELARRAGDALVDGVDSSPAMIERAIKLRAGLDPAIAKRVAFAIGDMRDFNSDREYTVVFSNAAMQWVREHGPVLASWHRALRPGGRLAVQVPANEHETAQATMHAMAADAPWNEWLTSVRTPSDRSVRAPAEYAAMLAEIGYGEIDCHYHEFHHAMGGAAEVVEFSRATSLRPFLERLPPERHADFIAELTRRLEQAYGTRGPLTFNFRRLFISGRRARQ
jgi:trans-aconitate 2-methyltransferase